MNEDIKRRGRPPKSHLQEEHHFRTSDDAAAAGAPPAPAESDQADFESAEPIVEAVTVISPGDGYTSEPLYQPFPRNIESPIEEKIHNLVEHRNTLNGWHPLDTEIVLELPPRNGNPVRLSETPDSEGVIAFWKRERAFANATKRWQEHGVWRDFYTGMKIDFEPKYWKDRF